MQSEIASSYAMVVAEKYISLPGKEKPLSTASRAKLQAPSKTGLGKKSQIPSEDKHGKKG